MVYNELMSLSDQQRERFIKDLLQSKIAEMMQMQFDIKTVSLLTGKDRMKTYMFRGPISQADNLRQYLRELRYHYMKSFVRKEGSREEEAVVLFDL